MELEGVFQGGSGAAPPAAGLVLVLEMNGVETGGGTYPGDTRALKGSFLVMSSSSDDNESISRSILLTFSLGCGGSGTGASDPPSSSSGGGGEGKISSSRGAGGNGSSIGGGGGGKAPPREPSASSPSPRRGGGGKGRSSGGGGGISPTRPICARWAPAAGRASLSPGRKGFTLGFGATTGPNFFCGA